MLEMCTLESLQRMRVSSTYWIQLMLPETLKGPILLISLLFAATLSICFRTSATKMNKKGGNGSPCLKPLPALIHFIGSPFMSGVRLLA